MSHLILFQVHPQKQTAGRTHTMSQLLCLAAGNALFKKKRKKKVFFTKSRLYTSALVCRFLAPVAKDSNIKAFPYTCVALGLLNLAAHLHQVSSEKNSKIKKQTKQTTVFFPGGSSSSSFFGISDSYTCAILIRHRKTAVNKDGFSCSVWFSVSPLN